MFRSVPHVDAGIRKQMSETREKMRWKRDEEKKMTKKSVVVVYETVEKKNALIS